MTALQSLPRRLHDRMLGTKCLVYPVQNSKESIKLKTRQRQKIVRGKKKVAMQIFYFEVEKKNNQEIYELLQLLVL